MIKGPPPHVEVSPEIEVAGLMKELTPWSGWLELTGEGPLSWPYVVATLMRNVDIRKVIMPVVRALEKSALIVERRCVRQYKSSPDNGPIGFLDWLALWQDHPEAEPLNRTLAALARKHKGDAAVGLNALADEEARPGATLWFLTCAIAEWLSLASPMLRDMILDDHDWIAETAGRNPDEVVAQVYASLYEAFVARGRCPASPIDVVVADHLREFENSAHRVLYRRVYTSLPIERWIRMAQETEGDLVAMLGPGPQWPSAAANVVVSIEHGLVDQNTLTLTDAAKAVTNVQQIDQAAGRKRPK